MKQVYVENNLGEGFEHDYDIMYEDDKRVVFYSNSPEWADRLKGTAYGHIKEHGDGVKIKIGKETMDLDFCDYLVLKILIASDLNDTDSFEIRESKTIKKWGNAEDTEIVESLK